MSHTNSVTHKQWHTQTVAHTNSVTHKQCHTKTRMFKRVPALCASGLAANVPPPAAASTHGELPSLSETSAAA